MEQEEIKGQMDIFDFKECIPGLEKAADGTIHEKGVIA